MRPMRVGKATESDIGNIASLTSERVTESNVSHNADERRSGDDGTHRTHSHWPVICWAMRCAMPSRPVRSFTTCTWSQYSA